MNIAFYISGKGRRARKIIETGGNKIFPHLKLIISDSKFNNDLLKFSDLFYYELIDLDVIQESQLKINLFLSDLLLEKLNEFKIDYLFVWGDRLLKGKILEKYQNRMINFHPSVLPLFPGQKSIDKALKNNSFLLGNTAHFIDRGIDSGPIIMQSIFHSSYFSEKGYDGILDAQIPMFFQIFSWLKEGRLKISDNNIVNIEGADYAKMVFFPELEKDE